MWGWFSPQVPQIWFITSVIFLIFLISKDGRLYQGFQDQTQPFFDSYTQTNWVGDLLIVLNKILSLVTKFFKFIYIEYNIF